MTRSASLAVLFVSLALFEPSLARAGACPVCTSAADCSGDPAFCVLHDSDIGCGAARQICCPGQACAIGTNGRPSCESRGTCTVIDERADAGPGTDGGASTDAGPGTDGGAGTDAGSSEADAGSSGADAGSSGTDAGTSAGDSGGGGCRAGTRSSGTGVLAAMVLVVGLVLRRRAAARAL